ncbi:hypothetical protein KBD34_03665 [Patescibacteria group bacterium]|nr:hypothetical protein [Patescibacteria group bacterium]
MDTDAWQEGFRRCPKIVQDYLLDPQSGDNEDKAQTSLALDNDAWDRVSDPAWRLIYDGMTKQEFREEIKQVAGDHNPDEIERVLLQYLVFPLADMVPWDVEARLQELGVALSQLQISFRISLRPMSYGAAARRIAANAKLSILTEEVARRLREILVSYLKDVRTLEQVKQALQQSQGEGGVGFSRQQADSYVEELERLQLAVQIMSEQEYAEWYSNFQREANIRLMQEPIEAKQAAANASTTGAPDSVEGDVVPVVRGSNNNYDALLEAVVQETVKTLAVTGLDEYLSKRLGNIVSTRLRDVRNQLQVKEILVRDSKIGGLDRHPEEAEAMAGVIEAAYQAHRAELTEAEQKRIESMKQAQEQKREVRRKQESDDHAEWYRQKIQEANPWAAAIEAQKTAGTNSGQVSWPTATATSQSAGSVPAADPNARPTVDSIRAPARLTSLGNELGGITLAEFRRIARTPEESMERLWQKLETLKQESYERWQEGAQAWRQSPLQQQYLQIVAQSFTSGRPVAEIAREQHEKDPNQPTAEEIGAILLLNNRLNV